MFEFNNVYKKFKISKNHPGLIKTIKGLFAPQYTIPNVIDNLSFKINEGELVGLIGENGAGKSTTVKLATGILFPTKGQVLFDGLEVYKNRRQCASEYGVVFGQRRSLWWQLTARDGLEALGRIYCLKSSETKNRIKELTDLFELNEFIDQPIRQLSLGQRVRCEVASCFIHRPRIVFLDEPTIGVDILGKIRMREYLKRINRQDGTAVLLTSHDLFDVERICKRIMILDKGKLILDDTFESMRMKYCGQRILRLNLASPINNGWLKEIKGIKLIPGEERLRVKIQFNPIEMPIVKLMNELQRRLDIIDFTVEDLPIDEFVAGIYKANV